MANILIVEDTPDQARTIAALLESAGHATTMAANGRLALFAVAADLPDLVVTDLIMPQLDGLQLVEALRDRHPSLPVILMTAHGSAEIAMQALRKGAASYVPKSELPNQLVDTAADILELARSRSKREQLLHCLVKSRSHFVLGNDSTLVSPLVTHIQEATASRRGGVDETQLMQVGLSLHEALNNAIQHGNLGFTSEIIHSFGDGHARLLQERLADPKYAQRRVHLTATISRSEVTLVVRDDGEGFDLSRVPDPTEPHNLVRPHGRGLYLIGTFMDEMRHNEAGNEITMVKHLDTATNLASPPAK